MALVESIKFPLKNQGSVLARYHENVLYMLTILVYGLVINGTVVYMNFI